MCNFRPRTAKEKAAAGLQQDNPKQMYFINTEDKGRGIAAGEKIEAGEFVCEYKYNTSYQLKEKPRYDEEYTINDEGCYTIWKFSFLLTGVGFA